MTDKRKLTPTRKKEIARAAASARWGKSTVEKKIPQSRGVKSRLNVDDFCRTMAISFHLPREFYDKPAGAPAGLSTIDIAAARARFVVQLGHEVGLQPAQSISSIIIKHGIATIRGDAQLALVMNSGKAEYVKEYTEGGELFIDGEPNPLFTAICESFRFGDQVAHLSGFSVQDAICAGLWGKAGGWLSHPARMLKYKARSFGLRDKYPDVLKGLCHSTEEMEGEANPANHIGLDIAPLDAAKKLSGIIDERMLHNTKPNKKGDDTNAKI